ncbi:MAG: ATP-dependent sacrificial sulfur transferase LarE [Candidatus Aminicenantes bacterium]|nr:ATP-dependent sacrificial sulfur transferase LarE [Candidatus Aminicenantes bacterium]
MKTSGKNRTTKTQTLSPALESKYRKLQKILEAMGSGLVAVSGGVDSSLLLAVAKEVLDDKLRAVIFTGPIFPSEEIKDAERLCRRLRVKYEKFPSEYWRTEEFKKNEPERCYYCKMAMFSRLKDLAREYGLAQVMEGSNLDDDLDYRPGKKALAQLGIRSPLHEAGFRKNDIRRLAKFLGLRNWNLPSRACLASRIPYYQRIDLDRLSRIAEAEKLLLKAGFSQVRVRDHGEMARVEILPEEFKKFTAGTLKNHISRRLHRLGWKFVTLDLDGYRTGSLNLAISQKKKT